MTDELAVDSVLQRALKIMAERLDVPALICNKDLKCVFSSRQSLIPVGSDLSEYGDIAPPSEHTARVALTVGGRSYCARLTPFEEDLLLCELFDEDALLDMAVRTDFFQRVAPFFSAIEHNTSKLWQTLFALGDCLKNGVDIKGLEQRLCQYTSEISSVVKNGYEYSLMLTHGDPTVINAVALANGLVNRCNAILAKCARRVWFVAKAQRLLVAADSRHAVTALTNLIQNALLYSPRECVPVMTIDSCIENGRSCVLVQITNDSCLFIGEDELPEIKFHRAGTGIPIIKRFAENADGRFFFNVSGHTVTVGIVLPEIKQTDDLNIEEGGYSYYDTGIPDIVEVKMREVIGFFT